LEVVQLTKFTHACVRLDDGNRVLVIDPGVFSEVDEAIEGAGAILVTHEHADHIDVDRVRAALGRDSRMRLYAPPAVAGELVEFGEQVVPVASGERFEAAGFAVQAFGGQHAVIHPAIPMVANLGYLVEGVYHPGDSFTVPAAEVRTLLLPTSAPWSKAAEVIDFAIAVRAPRMHQIHDSLVTDTYAAIVEGHLDRLAGPHGAALKHLGPGESVAV
jgi:L-ascorbate metabolism protein UlaG (beta-lactamase superfamily)